MRYFDAQYDTWQETGDADPTDAFADDELLPGEAADAAAVLVAAEAAVHDDLHDERLAAWKTLVRYVWHNARSVDEAGYYFGLACRMVWPELVCRMLTEEREMLRWPRVKSRGIAAVLGFASHAVYRDWPQMPGYTPLSALRMGEDNEWAQDEAKQDARRAALMVMLRSAWQSLDGRWERSLKEAFMNFTVIAAEDTGLLSWVTQTEFGLAFKETRAAVSARRKRRVRVVLEANGTQGTTGPGGKSASAIAQYAVSAKGNQNRRAKPVGASEADDTSPSPAYLARMEHGFWVKPQLAAMTAEDRRKHFQALEEAQDRRRLGLEDEDRRLPDTSHQTGGPCA